jgi:hypothetical protein
MDKKSPPYVVFPSASELVRHFKTDPTETGSVLETQKYSMFEQRQAVFDPSR